MREKKHQTNQTTMNIFKKRIQEKPQAGPLGCIPEKNIVIPGDDSTMQVTAPLDPPVG